MGIVCPFISSGKEIFQCHPMCVCLDENKKCKILGYFDDVKKISKKND
ncbi:MAG: hypothetical protein ACRDD7_15070 [Peptostreptococcaceae bacterium]